MKTYSIGRDVNCDIVINDSTDVISRRHALLNVTSSGKMTIIDQSSNGTYVNGIRVSQNVSVPVTRKDIISLAHVSKLDWTMVPKSNVVTKYFILTFIGIILTVSIVFGLKCIGNSDKDGYNNQKTTTEVADSLERERVEHARLDSVTNAAKIDSIRQDSIQRAEKNRNDSTRKVRRNESINKKEKESDKAIKEGTNDKPAKSKQDVG